MADLAFVSAVSGSNYTGTTVPSIATSSLTFTAGNLIVVKVRALGTVTGISDTLGNSYTLRASDAAGSIRIYSCANCAGGSSAITAAFSPNINYVSIVAEQYSAAAKSNELIDDFPVAAVTSGTTIDNPYDTGGYAKALVVGLADVYAAGSFGFAAQGASGDAASYTESVSDHTSASFFYRLPTAPLTSDTVRATCTTSGTEKHLLVATFKPLNAYANVSDAVGVSEFVKAVLTPLAVHASESVTVSESATFAAATVGATIQIFQSRFDQALAGTNTIWNQPFGGSEGWSTTEGNHQVRVLRACTVRNFAVELTTAPGGSTTRTFTIRKNGANTALSFAITGSGTTGSDFVNEVSFSAGDLINVQIAQSGGTPAATGFIHYSLEVECIAENTSIYGSARGGGGVVVGRVQGVFAGYDVFTDPSVDGVSIATSVAACAGSLTEYRIDLAGAPTAGKSWTFVIYKNGVKQDGAGGTTDTQLTIADAATTNTWTGTLTVAAGDLLRYQVESSSGSPASSAGSTACVFVSTTAGESHWCSFGKANASPLYLGPLGMNTQSTTEADAQTKVLGPTAFTLLRLYGHRHSVDYTTLTLRNNGSNTALSATPLSTGTTVSDTDTISPAQNDLLSLSLTGSSGFFTGRIGSGLCLYALRPVPPLTASVSDSITVSESVTAARGTLQVHAGRTQNNFSASATNYVSPINTNSWDATEHRGTVICAANGTFSNWSITLPSAPGVGKSVTFTLRKNQSDTAAVIAISGTATSGQYTSPITLADGDELTIKSVPSGTPTVSGPNSSWDFLSATSGESIYGAANTNGAVAISRTGRVLFHPDISNWDAGGGRDVVSMAGTINKLTIKLDADVGASGSFTFTINKNGTAQDGTGGTPDTRITFTTGTTKASSTFSLSVSPGDTLSLSAVETGSAATVRPITGVRATATTPGQSMTGAVSAGNFVSGPTLYGWPTAGSSGAAAPDTTEANREVTLGITGFRLRNLQVALNNSPTNTYTFNTRKSGADGASSVAITGGATSGSNSSGTVFVPGDRLSMEIVPSGGPLTRAGGYSWIQDHLAQPLSVNVSDSITVSESVTKRLDALPLEYLTTPQQVYPTGGSGISVTPSGSAFTYGSWVELHASTPADWVIFGCDVECPATDQVQFQIGIGSAGNETAVITVRDVAGGIAAGMYFYTPVPIDGFPAGSRVSVRVWVGSTNASAWTDFRVWYYTKPLSHTITTAASCLASTGQDVTGNGVAWGNSSWVAIETSSPAEYAVGGMYFSGLFNTAIEFDIGTGAAASETVIATIKHQRADNGSNGSLRTAMIRPLVGPIAAGTRISIRTRNAAGSTATINVGLLYIPSPASSTTQIVSAVGPAALPAAGTVSPTDSANWTFGSWVEISSALPSDGAITSMSGYQTFALGDAEVQLGVGSAGSEVAIATWRWHFGSANIGGGRRTHNLTGINVSAGQRLAVRTRHENVSFGTTLVVGVEWVPSQSAFDQHTSLIAGTIPSGASVSNASSGGSWANSSWVQLIAAASVTTPIYLNAVTPVDTGSAGPYEVDIGIGGSGSEVVATTLHIRYHGSGNERRPLGALLRINAGTRISFRVRSGTGQSHHVALDYVAAPPEISVSDSITVTESVRAVLLSPPAASTRWRLNITESNSATLLQIAEITMATTNSGADACSGGTASASSEYSGSFNADKAFDNNAGSKWSTANLVTAAWIEYTFASPVTIVEYSIQIDGATEAPKAWTFEYYDGSTWQVVDVQSGQTGWTANELRAQGFSGTGLYRVNQQSSIVWNSTGSPAYSSGIGFAHLPGKTLIVVVGEQTQVPTSLTDLAGNTFTHAVDVSSGDYKVSIWYAKNISGHPTNVVTANFSGNASYVGIVVLQHAGLSRTAPLDVTATGTALGTVVTTGSLTTAQADEVHVIAPRWGLINAITWPAGFTDVHGDSVYNRVADKITSALVSGTYSITHADFASLLAIVATFKSAATGAAVSESITVAESVTGQLGLAKSVSDSITVSESVTASLTPLAVRASDSATVTESVTAYIGALPRQVLFGRNANPGTGGAKYTSITSALGTWDTEALRRSPCAAAGVLRNLVVELSAAPGGGRSRTFTLRKNGAATALTVTISNTATTARITGTDVAVSVGDLLALEATRSGSAAAASVRWSLEFEGTGSGYTSALGTTNSASGTRYAGVFAFTGTLATPVSDTRNVVAAAGTLVRMVAAVNTAPGVGNGLTFYINKNGVRQDGSGGTVNTACALVGAITAVTATFSLSLAAGDVVYTECVPSGSFSTRNWSLGTGFNATTVGESQCCGATTNALSTSATQYAFVPAHSSPGTTEAAFAQRLIGGITTFRLFNMQVLLSVAPGGGKSRTLDLRKNATSPGPSVTISGASTTGSDTASGNVADTNQWNLRATPTSTPAAATAFWGLIQSSAEFDTLSVDVHDSVTVTDAAVGQRSAHKAASDSVSVSESVTVQLNPLVARVSHTVTVSESVTKSGTLSRAVFDAITVTEPAVAVLLTPVLRVDVSDSITVTDAVTSSIPPSRFVFDTVSVSESVSVAFGNLTVDVHETIRVRDSVIRNAASPSEKTATDFVRVTDVVTAQMYIGGGLAVRVSETITVAESPFNVGYDFAPGTTIPDTTTLNIGPEPGVPEAGLGDDYWEDGY